MSRSIVLSQIKIKSLLTFEVSFQKYCKELETQKVNPIPVFVRTPETERHHVLGSIRTGNVTVATLSFHPNEKNSRETKPVISEDGRIQNGYGILRGDEDFLKENARFKNPILHDRLDAYYGAEACQATLARKGFQNMEYTVDENCEASFVATQEIEEPLVASGF